MEILPGYEEILNQSKIVVQTAQYGNQDWAVLLDEDGIIGADGKPIAVQSTVNQTQDKKQLTAIFDTG